MQPNIVIEALPTLSRVLSETVFETDAQDLIAFAADGRESLKEALKERVFRLNELMWLVSGIAVPEWGHSDARRLEEDLKEIENAVGIARVKSVYKRKFLVDQSSPFEDLRYEIAATAHACRSLDPGSIELEKPIEDSLKKPRDWKNSDIFGKHHGMPVRIEVTVHHETQTHAVSLELDEIVRSARTPTGFAATLQAVPKDKGQANHVRSLLESLSNHHVSTGGANYHVDGLSFEWSKGSYRCLSANGLFRNVVFYSEADFDGANEFKVVNYPVTTQATVPRSIREDYPNPKGVVTSADIPGAPTNEPTSSKIHGMLAKKLLQCEAGMVNIVAMGIPYPYNDSDLKEAVFGVSMVTYGTRVGPGGLEVMPGGMVTHDARAPFVRQDLFPGNALVAGFVEPFKILSAVWKIRLGLHEERSVLTNPNANMPVPADLVSSLSSVPHIEVVQSVSDFGSAGSPMEVDSPKLDENARTAEQLDSARWFVLSCEGSTEARRVLQKIEQADLTFDEIRFRVLEKWKSQEESLENMVHVSPTNEELGLEFVVECGGIERAKDVLELYMAAPEDGGITG